MKQPAAYKLVYVDLLAILIFPFTVSAQTLVSAEIINEITNPVPVTQATCTEDRVVGLTSTATKGAIVTTNGAGVPIRGFAAMALLCRHEVSENSRPATPVDWANSPDAPRPESGRPVWLLPPKLHPIILPVLSGGLNGHAFSAYASDVPYLSFPKLRDGIGKNILRGYTCDGYRNSDGRFFGFVGLATGDAHITACDGEYVIACAAPVVLPLIGCTTNRDPQ